MSNPEIKTDNALEDVKLHLRRYFLNKYHKGSKPIVLDCCQAGGVMWKALRKDHECEYVGYDIKPKKGRVKIDSIRILQNKNLQFDVVDIDTYGEPWKHYFSMLKNTKLPVTVFLTHGIVKMGGGNTSTEAIEAFGLSGISDNAPRSLLAKITSKDVSYCLAVCYKYDIKIVEAKEAFPKKNARYYGVRLDRA